MKSFNQILYNRIMKSYSPKGRVANIADIVYPNAIIEVRGVRIKGVRGGNFIAEVNINNNTVVRAQHKDWRKAYKMLEIELSKRFVA